MISYAEALRIAQGRKKRIDNCIEHENAFVFGADDDFTCASGYDNPCVVLKESGKVESYAYYVTHCYGPMVQEIMITPQEG